LLVLKINADYYSDADDDETVDDDVDDVDDREDDENDNVPKFVKIIKIQNTLTR